MKQDSVYYVIENFGSSKIVLSKCESYYEAVKLRLYYEMKFKGNGREYIIK